MCERRGGAVIQGEADLGVLRFVDGHDHWLKNNIHRADLDPFGQEKLLERHSRTVFAYVMAVALIAISRKVIILDVKDHSGIDLLGVAAIILALSMGYFLIRRHDRERAKDKSERDHGQTQ